MLLPGRRRMGLPLWVDDFLYDQSCGNRSQADDPGTLFSVSLNVVVEEVMLTKVMPNHIVISVPIIDVPCVVEIAVYWAIAGVAVVKC